ncbi:MAG TPA: hypothetical protein VIL60_03945 [Rhodanobacter sp.]
MTLPQQPPLTDLLERDLLVRFGAPLIGGEELRVALGYPTAEALRQAMSRGTVPVPVFAVPHRRGKYALVRDIAAWLATLRQGAVGPAGVQEVPMR